MEKKKIFFQFSEKSDKMLISTYSYFLPIISKECMSHSDVGDLMACTSSVKN